ncbi:hypothetical protein [Xanthomonas pisi]|uniref:hypothetical protein n=1 Tax=Xanthomonas pisi TaxID=56457 RepID=UPI0015E45E16|nr:hypothetical protein [Xanthomonas pisi]
MDPKLKELVARTNLGDLLQPTSPEIDLNQPVETAPPTKSEPVRSTVDPFQINFATADIVGKLQDPRTGKGVTTFALVFLGGPLMIFWIGLVFMAWTSPNGSVFGKLFASALGLAIVGFLPYVVFARRRKQPRRN